MPLHAFESAAGIVLLTLLGLTASAGPTTMPVQPPKLGEKAPDFTLNDLRGKPVLLYELTRQSPVALLVLRGWPGYQCPFCTRQVADFIANQQKLADAKLQVLLVYPGPAEQLKEHADEFVRGKSLPLNFSFVIDPNYSFVNAYGLRWDAPQETAYPSTFVIDPDNVVRLAHISHSHGDRASVEEVLKAVGK